MTTLDPGGPCPHCPPADPKNVAMLQWAQKNASSPEEFMKVVKLLGTDTCTVCGGLGFIRVCRTCGGRGCTEQTAIKDVVGELYEEDEEYEVEPEISTNAPNGDKNILRPAVMATRKVTRARDKIVDAMIDGPPCGSCKGTGQEAVTAEQVASGG